MNRQRPTKCWEVTYGTWVAYGDGVLMGRATWRCFAYDEEHVREKFYSGDDDEYGIESIRRLPARDRPH